MQNILINIQQVTKAVSDLLKQMNIKDDNDPDSVRRDKEFLKKLKNKIQKHREELLKMKNDLVREKARQMAESSGTVLSSAEIEEKATKEVEEMINQVLT
jgi:polyribonucleotide nucleotidyltransferase